MDTQSMSATEVQEFREGLKNPDFQEFLRSQFFAEDAALGKELPAVRFVLPEVGFCFRQLDKRGRKVFINVTQSDDVGPPTEKTGLVGDEEQEGISVPLSASRGRNAYDSGGELCVVYDVAVNPKSVEQARKDAGFEAFLCQLATEYIEQRDQLGLNRKFKVLKRCKCKGVPVLHTIRSDGGRPKIRPAASVREVPDRIEREMSDRDGADAVTTAASAAAAAPAESPPSDVRPRCAVRPLDEDADGRPARLELVVHLPGDDTDPASELEVVLEPWLLRVARAGRWALETPLPVWVDADAAAATPARLHRAAGTLVLHCPVLPAAEQRQRQQQAEQERAAVTAAAQAAAARRDRAATELEAMVRAAAARPAVSHNVAAAGGSTSGGQEAPPPPRTYPAPRPTRVVTAAPSADTAAPTALPAAAAAPPTAATATATVQPPPPPPAAAAAAAAAVAAGLSAGGGWAHVQWVLQQIPLHSPLILDLERD